MVNKANNVMTLKGAERWAEKIVSKYFPSLSYHTPFLG